jgi:CO/xanthine dehydrogenase Mo-binding subunit
VTSSHAASSPRFPTCAESSCGAPRPTSSLARSFRLIGKDVARIDTAAKVDGTAKFGIDTQLLDMLYAAILYPSVQHQKPEQIDNNAAKAVKGVIKVVALPAGVGVISETIVNESYLARIMPPDVFAKVRQDVVFGRRLTRDKTGRRDTPLPSG